MLRRLPTPTLELWGARSTLTDKPSFEMETYQSDTCRNRYLSATVKGRWKKCYASDGESSYKRASVRPVTTPTHCTHTPLQPRPILHRMEGTPCCEEAFESAPSQLGKWRRKFGLDTRATSYRFIPGGVFAASRRAIQHTSRGMRRRVSPSAQLHPLPSGPSSPPAAQEARTRRRHV